MTVCGFSFIRNGIRFDYPFLESITSLLPLVDRFVIAVGDSDDGTRDRIAALHSPKITIIDTRWDTSLRSGGRILAEQTDIALDYATGDWGFYLQGDEVLHEDEVPAIREALQRHRDDETIEGLLFRYRHFYGTYDWVGDSRQWYRHEVRAVRLGIGIRSWGDAQGFRRNRKKLHVKKVDATINHYGWVKPPAVQQEKLRSFHKLWHPDQWVSDHVGGSPEYSYKDGGRLKRFDGAHPAVMHQRIAAATWPFHYDAASLHIPLKDRLLDAIEDRTGYRVGEYRNYILLP